MSLVTDIQTIVNTLYPSATFTFASEFNANKESYSTAESGFPLIILDNTLPKRNIINPNANITKPTRIKMLFLTKHTDKNNVNQTDTEMNSLVEAMEVIADRVFINIYQLDSIRRNANEISEYQINPRFRVFNTILTGVEGIANWKENKIINWCKTP
jgi:hypothetical protein